MNVMAENLISFGLAMSKNEVIKLMIQLIEGQRGHSSSQQTISVIYLKQFIKVFEKDSFGEKAITAIKV